MSLVSSANIMLSDKEFVLRRWPFVLGIKSNVPGNALFGTPIF